MCENYCNLKRNLKHPSLQLECQMPHGLFTAEHIVVKYTVFLTLNKHQLDENDALVARVL